MKRSEQVDIEHCPEVLIRRLGQRSEAIVAGVMDEHVDFPESVQRGFDDRLAAFHSGDTVGVRDSLDAHPAQRLRRFLRRTGITARARQRAAVVIDDDLRAQ